MKKSGIYGKLLQFTWIFCAILLLILVVFFSINYSTRKNVDNNWEIDEKRCQELIELKLNKISSYVNVYIPYIWAFIETVRKDDKIKDETKVDLYVQYMATLDKETRNFINEYLAETISKEWLGYSYSDSYTILPKYCNDSQIKELNIYDDMIRNLTSCVKVAESNELTSQVEYFNDLVNCNFDLNDSYWNYLLEKGWFTWDYEDLLLN